MSKTYFFSPNFLFLLIWFSSLFLYCTGLSDLVKIDSIFILLIISFVFLYFCFSIIVLKKIYLLIHAEYLVKKVNDFFPLYRKLTLLLFFIGSIGFFLEVYFYSEEIPIFLDNKIDTGAKNHYIHYITQFSMYSAILANGIAILSSRKRYFIISILASFELLIWLKRGEILPILFSFIFVFYIKMSYIKRKKLFYMLFGISIILFLILFSTIGNARVEHVLQEVYGQTFNERYLLPDWLPLEISWVYIYIATTLENARDIIFEQSIESYTYGAQLFYPFLAPFMKELIQPTYEAYLAKYYGLTVSSFLSDAINDFDIMGIYIYTFCFFFISVLGRFFVNRGLFGIALCTLVNLMILWSVFSNSLKNGVYVIGIILFFLLSLIYERKSISHLW